MILLDKKINLWEINKGKMDKENLSGKEFLPASLNNFPENLKNIALSLIRRAERISFIFKPLSYQEAIDLLPDLRKYFDVYKENLEKFVPFVPNLKKKESPDDFFHFEIRNFLTNKIGCSITSFSLNEEQRKIANEGKESIGKRYKKTGVGWNAIYSFWFNCLRDFCPNEEIFKIKSDPFAVLLSFAEKGALPRTDYQEKFLVDIPILFNENDKDYYFYGCWSPINEPSIIQGHLSSEDCSHSHRRDLDKVQPIVHNKDNAQDKPYIDSPSRQQFTIRG